MINKMEDFFTVFEDKPTIDPHKGDKISKNDFKGKI